MNCPCCDTELSGPAKPVLRVFIGRRHASVWIEDVEDVMHNNVAYEDSAWTYLTTALSNEIYDDSDPSSAVTSNYVCVDRDELLTQLRTWRERVKGEDWFDESNFPLPEQSLS